MGILEDELGPETTNFRKAQQEKWDFIRAARDDYFNDAKKYTDAGTALRAADKYIRPEVRIFVFDLFSRVPPGELAEFVRRFPPTWPDATEVLLSETVIPAMIGRSFPHRQQAQNVDAVTVAVAKDDAAWGKALDTMAEATGTALKAVGGAVEGGLNAAGDFARTLAWVPVVLAGGLAIGATVIGVTYVLKKA